MDQLTNKIKQVFADLDAQEIKQETVYVLETADMVRNTRDYQELKNIMLERGIDRDLIGTIRYQTHNKTLQEANAIIVEIALKPILAKQEKRNFKIAKKLFEKGVKDINLNLSEIVWGGNFETELKVNNLLVTLKVIFAGGYNVQRYHPRILCNVKECK